MLVFIKIILINFNNLKKIMLYIKILNIILIYYILMQRKQKTNEPIKQYKK